MVRNIILKGMIIIIVMVVYKNYKPSKNKNTINEYSLKKKCIPSWKYNV